MTREEQLRAMKAAIDAEANKAEPAPSLDAEPEPSQKDDVKPDATPDAQVDKTPDVDDVDKGDASKPWEDVEVPDGIPAEFADVFREQAWKRADAIVTKNRQKDKKELEEAKAKLKAEDVFGNDVPSIQAPKAKSYEEILADIPEESREDLKPLLDKVREITDSQTAPLRQMQMQNQYAQRHQIEKQHFNELLDKYKGFEFTQSMVDAAKQAQQQYPNYTVAQLMQAQNSEAIFDWKVENKAKSILEQYKNEPAEHPGGSTRGASPARSKNKNKLNFDGMSNADKLKYLEENLPKHPGA